MGVLDAGTWDDGATGDGFGLGLADTQDGFSGTIDANDPSQGTELGADPQLDYTDGLSDFGIPDFIENPGEWLSTLNLSGASDTPPNAMVTTGAPSANGAGYAGQTQGTTQPAESSEFNTALAGLQKFGASFAKLFSGAGTVLSMTPQTGPQANQNPNVSTSIAISKTHSLVVVAVIGGLLLFLLIGSE